MSAKARGKQPATSRSPKEKRSQKVVDAPKSPTVSRREDRQPVAEHNLSHSHRCQRGSKAHLCGSHATSRSGQLVSFSNEAAPCGCHGKSCADFSVQDEWQ